MNDAMENQTVDLAALRRELSDLKEDIAGLKTLIKAKDARITALEDIQAIQKLQCAYGYYLEHWMGEEIIDCFSKDPGVSVSSVEGIYKGPEGVRRYFGKMMDAPPEMLHMVLQTTPVITLNDDGRTAGGRWYGYGSVAMPAGQGVRQSIMSVVYEMEYIKENGVWKILLW